ncbi:chromosomal replication initiator protein DnaA [Gordonibacter sp. An230]|uniref:chromosomal replication initiator protein DnaA n=1 Tax=Gordonibacter sp. An230 TaxID=1965592 RepID=UPI000B38F769|nr:chromosomal replication initiator protein DnaA [Gordonibacter sp. An230]OUO92364.1 chromosomal replication initiator protein DnaA [Gordonibacter sp. An230]
MNSESIEQSWQEVCSQIKSYNNIDPTQISAFFSRLHPQAMSEGFLMLTADNDFIKTWIERHYAEFIQQALIDLYHVPFTVVIEVDLAGAPPVPNAVQASGAHPPTLQPSTAATAATATQTGPHTTPAASKTQATAQDPSKEDDGAVALPDPANPLPSTADMADAPTSTLTFENFVIGDSNRMAYSMAVAVAEMPGKAHLNPLFIYGKSGLGKTHLMRAIQNYVNETMPHLSVIYVDSAELLSDYMEASAAHDKEKSSYKNFKTRYEEADVLLIDDVQYLQGKKQTLDIVFQIFNKLTSQGRQVVLSADRAPKNIDIDERYKSRFNSGGTFDIQPPEIETKLGIVKSFVEEYRESEGSNDFDIPADIQMYIAESSSSNIRELKSAVTKVIYQMTFFNQPMLSLDDVRSLLENHFSGGSSKRLTIADIQKEVEAFYKVSHADLIGNKRTRNITYARQIAMYLCRQMLDLPFNDIGKKFNRDHSTVMYSVTNIENKIKENRELSEELETLRQIIHEI